MTRTLKGHFDGRAIIPEGPVDLPRDRRLIIQIDTAPTQAEEEPAFGTAAYLAKHLDPMSDEDADEMRRAIEEECERIEPDPDINLD
jgi:hypothetical protein